MTNQGTRTIPTAAQQETLALEDAFFQGWLSGTSGHNVRTFRATHDQKWRAAYLAGHSLGVNDREHANDAATLHVITARDAP